MQTVRDVMTVRVATVGPDASLKQVAETLVDHRISGLPVVDGKGRVLGVVSETDIVAKTAEGVIISGLTWLLADVAGGTRRLRATTAREAMTAPAVTIDPSAPLPDAARVMIDRRVNRLPVVESGRLAGIVTRFDIVRSFARSDGELSEEILSAMGEEPLGLQPGDVQVTVQGGRVRLSGTVPTKNAADLLAAHVRTIPGVVTVDRAGLTWSP